MIIDFGRYTSPNNVIFFVCNVRVRFAKFLNFGFMAIIRHVYMCIGPRYVINKSTHCMSNIDSKQRTEG